jgi:hypothetical protein
MNSHLLTARRATVLVPGGLGNQLFSYFLALYVKENTIAAVQLDFSNTDRIHYKNSISLLDFDLNFTELELAKKSKSAVFQSSKIFQNRVCKKIASKINENRLILFRPGFDSKNHVHDFLETWQESSRFDIKIDGYFGDFAFYDHLKEKTRALELLNPSKKFRELSLRIESLQSVAIHHRLGDFVDLSESVGLLGKKFYSEAINQALSCGYKNLLVFSNQPKLSKEIFKSWGLSDSKINWIGPESIDSPAETLVLMSKASSIICANSTFSFWAAKLAEKSNSKIYFPASWRRDKVEGIRSIPSQWTPIASDWSNNEIAAKVRL